MSLDVYLEMTGIKVTSKGSGIFIRENGATKEITRREWDEKFPGQEPVVVTNSMDSSNYVYHANITHNLGKMASKAGIYYYLWRPDEIGISIAHQLIDPLKTGLGLLQNNREYFEKENPENGWGDYDVLVRFVQEYIVACEDYPSAEVTVCR